MKKKRFRGKTGRRRGQAARHLSKRVRELHQAGELEAWDDKPERPAAGPKAAEARSPGEASAPKTVDGEAEARSGAGAGPRFRGRITSLASGLAWVRPDPRTSEPEAVALPEPNADGGLFLCVLPTALARDQRSRIAVGDRVRFVPRGEDFRVEELERRRTFLARPDPLHPRLQRLIAANVDAVVQVASIKRPALRPALVDRYLIAIQQGGAEPILCVNKIDLVPEAEREEALEPLAAYRDLGLPWLLTSAETGEGVEALRQRLAGKTVAFVGHSGVGKSSLVNALAPEVGAAVGEVSRALDKGRHTTTRSSLYQLGGEGDAGIEVIDTPGIRELGLLDLDAASLQAYFPDFAEHADTCRFHDCSHSHEPDCAVRTAADAGELPRARYATYLRILESLSEDER
ncbi:MAG: ribosome small subunit-dependent GTPase A [Holophagales bacterium]|nr:ribosome small subunit-dependent GTPase A [Holophagales bacterium]